MLATYDFGGNGPALLLLHGAGHNLGAWQPIAHALRKDWHVIGADLPGHGHSRTLLRWSWDEVVLELKEVIEHVTGPEVVVVGHSLGGILAWRLATETPLRAAINIDGWIGAPLPDLRTFFGPRLDTIVGGPVAELEAMAPEDATSALRIGLRDWHPDAREGLIRRMIAAATQPTTGSQLRPSAVEIVALYEGLEPFSLTTTIRASLSPVGLIAAGHVPAEVGLNSLQQEAFTFGRESLLGDLAELLGESAYREMSGDHLSSVTSPDLVLEQLVPLMSDLLSRQRSAL